MNKLESVEDFVSDESFQDFVLDKSAENVEKWQLYIIDNPNHSHLINEASQLIKTLSPGDLISVKKEPVFPRNKKNKHLNLLLIALSVFTAISLFIGFHFYKSDNSYLKDIHTIYASLDQVEKFELLDGSIVSLKPNSKIQIVGDWEKSRECIVIGDAYLDVNPSDLEFIVHSSNDKITVLGTKFFISNRKGFEIVLEEGSVKHSSSFTNDIKIQPNQKLFREGDEIVIQNVDATHYGYWKTDKLSFIDESLESIVNILQKSYNLTVSLQNSALKTKKITAHIPVNDPELLLKAIAEIYDIKLFYTNETYILR